MKNLINVKQAKAEDELSFIIILTSIMQNGKII